MYDLSWIDDFVAGKAARFGGKKRSNLEDSEFALPSERKFPIRTAKDVQDAARLVGKYKGPSSQETIRAGIRRRAKAIGAENSLPESWKP